VNQVGEGRDKPAYTKLFMFNKLTIKFNCLFNESVLATTGVIKEVPPVGQNDEAGRAKKWEEC